MLVKVDIQLGIQTATCTSYMIDQLRCCQTSSLHVESSYRKGADSKKCKCQSVKIRPALLRRRTELLYG